MLVFCLGIFNVFFVVLGYWTVLPSIWKYRPFGTLFTGINHEEEGGTWTFNYVIIALDCYTPSSFPRKWYHFNLSVLIDGYTLQESNLCGYNIQDEFPRHMIERTVDICFVFCYVPSSSGWCGPLRITARDKLYPLPHPPSLHRNLPPFQLLIKASQEFLAQFLCRSWLNMAQIHGF